MAQHNNTMAEPFDAGWLKVPGGHRLYVEQRGRRDGLPVVLLHGGPGSGCAPAMASFFDAGRYRVILPDQRGAGRSRPRGATAANTTAALLADCERLRNALCIDRWLLVGGSWGATLAVLYAAARREAVAGVLLRGLFLARDADLEWFFGGAAALCPEAWQNFAALAPAGTPALLPWLARAAAATAGWSRIARAWWAWERALAGLPAAPPPEGPALAALAAKYRLQTHYFRRRCFLRRDAVLEAMPRLAGLPTLLIHGRRDLVCRPESAWLARRALPSARLQWVAGAGHDPYAPAMARAVSMAARRFATHGDFHGLGR